MDLHPAGNKVVPCNFTPCCRIKWKEETAIKNISSSTNHAMWHLENVHSVRTNLICHCWSKHWAVGFNFGKRGNVFSGSSAGGKVCSLGSLMHEITKTRHLSTFPLDKRNICCFIHFYQMFLCFLPLKMSLEKLGFQDVLKVSSILSS